MTFPGLEMTLKIRLPHKSKFFKAARTLVLQRKQQLLGVNENKKYLDMF